jgi:hypothetical protein
VVGVGKRKGKRREKERKTRQGKGLAAEWGLLKSFF